MIRLVTPLVQDFLAIAAALPPDEQRQYLATTGASTYDAQTCARDMIVLAGETHCAAAVDGHPIAIGGYQLLRPGVWQGWMVAAAEEWPEHGRQLTALVRELQRVMLERDDCHRIEVLATREREHAHQWYVHGLGMRLEGVRDRCFANGADALCFVQFKREA